MQRIAVLLTAIAFAVVTVMAAPAGAQETDEPFQIEDAPADGGGIIPKPNSGEAPDSATDRGGALQLALLGLIVLFPLVAIVSVRRQGRRNREPSPVDAS